MPGLILKWTNNSRNAYMYVLLLWGNVLAFTLLQWLLAVLELKSVNLHNFLIVFWVYSNGGTHLFAQNAAELAGMTRMVVTICHLSSSSKLKNNYVKLFRQSQSVWHNISKEVFLMEQIFLLPHCLRCYINFSWGNLQDGLKMKVYILNHHHQDWNHQMPYRWIVPHEQAPSSGDGGHGSCRPGSNIRWSQGP